MKKDINVLTPSMEDYLEMIYRLSKKSGFTRINDLASSLNIQPPSATKMVQKLSKLGLINYEKYGVIVLKDEGKRIGNALLKRHKIIENFLTLIGVSSSGILEETEKIEHTINPETLKCINNLLSFFENNLDVLNQFKSF
ncbi:iron-dependent transcriptional repressor [Clostridium novyi NT]|uniref:Manganese transport regulator n=2 Tax=Clostridium novyi TaxID=1542 RepID=A0Q180_CLONN|nr:iron-dependent transcriptional repressor [Clostridium novyi NT]